MVNKHRGEVEVQFDGQAYRLCLTLGALAELEAAFADDDMLALAARFEGGRLRSQDAIRIIGAGLRGAGHDITDDAVASMRCDGGAAGYVAAVAELLEATFGGGAVSASDAAGGMERNVPGPKPVDAAAGMRPEVRGDGPFPGTR